MDTSEIYIKMCDCKEVKDMIQKIIETDHKRKVETRKRFADTKYSVRIPDIRTPDVNVYDLDGSPMRRIDLLSQDQIQEMMRKDHESNLDLLIHFYGFVTIDNPIGIMKLFDTPMEQLWLAFYMHEKHGKIWNGEEWKKEV